MFTIFALIAVVALFIIAIIKYKLHPFLGLIISAIIIGFLEGMDGKNIVDFITEGFGSTLKSIGIIIAFGTVIGAYLEYSGGAKTLAEKVISIIGVKNSALAMNITGYIISIPVFCDSGFVILSPLIKAISRNSGVKKIAIAIALSSGLYATHVFVPPTPGPLAGAVALEADLGLVILFGLITAIPVSLVGLLWAKYLSSKIYHEDNEKEIPQETSKNPKFIIAAAPIFIPILLIGLKSVVEYPANSFNQNFIIKLIIFIGNPAIALLIGVFLALPLIKYGKNKENWFSEGLKNAGVIILITGAGGAFGNVLRNSELTSSLQPFLSIKVGLLIPFLISMLLKSSQGSSTVAIVTTSAIVAPLLMPLGLETQMGRVLSVLAVSSGAMTVSHVNDSYFWVVAQFTNLKTETALKSHTVGTFFQGVTGILFVFLLSIFFL